MAKRPSNPKSPPREAAAGRPARRSASTGTAAPGRTQMGAKPGRAKPRSAKTAQSASKRLAGATGQTATPQSKRQIKGRQVGTASGPATTMRIAKAMARAGLCSRRDAESWINDKRVMVNGKTLDSPALNVDPTFGVAPKRPKAPASA